jgi:hypothetical protein
MKIPLSRFLFVTGLTSSSWAHAAPKNSNHQTMFVRPYVAPEGSGTLMARVEALENELGKTVYSFEYSMPKNTKLVLTILARHNGVLDREKSGVFHMMRYVEKDWATGGITFTRVFPQPLYNSKSKPLWGIGLSNYGYGIFERTPEDWMPSWREEQNTIDGEAAKKDAVLFSFLPDDKKFTLVIKAHFAPAPSYQNINDTKRYPLPSSIK